MSEGSLDLGGKPTDNHYCSEEEASWEVEVV